MEKQNLSNYSLLIGFYLVPNGFSSKVNRFLNIYKSL